MKWIKSQEQSMPTLENSVLTIGNFDGVHLGHQKLLIELQRQSKVLNLPSVVCTFKPHPLKVLKPEADVHRLFDYRDQAEMMERFSVDYLVEVKFTPQMSIMTPTEFMDFYILKHFNPKQVVVGYDFSIGKNKTGDYEFLKQYCEQHHIGCAQVSALEVDHKIVSSSLIRQELRQGNVEAVKSLLGRRYYLRGPVDVGNQRGKSLGIPTANMSPEVEFVPKNGVYFSLTHFLGKVYYSITNIGVNPTFVSEKSILKVETHILDFDLDIYGEQIKVELCQFHREEKKFENVSVLVDQIQSDIQAARDYFKKCKVD